MIIPEVSRGQSIGLTFSGGCTWRSNTVIMNGGRCGDSFNSRVTLIGSIWGKILLFAFPLSFVLFSAKMIIFFVIKSFFFSTSENGSFFVKFFHCNWIHERKYVKTSIMGTGNLVLLLLDCASNLMGIWTYTNWKIFSRRSKKSGKNSSSYIVSMIL